MHSSFAFSDGLNVTCIPVSNVSYLLQLDLLLKHLKNNQNNKPIKRAFFFPGF